MSLQRSLVRVLIVSLFSFFPAFESSAFPEHPRLIAASADWKRLAERRKSDAELDSLCAALIADAELTLEQAPLERRLVGRRLLNVSREFIRRTLLRAFAFRTTGDARYANAARRELAAVCAFSDWNPSHFLDVAEMSAGVAFAYDWLYDALSEAERAAARTALIRNALDPARNGHATFKMKNNWSQVCAGGIGLAAIALADEAPELAASVLAGIRRDVGIGLAAYAPDGVYPEGPSYWAYGTQYTALLDAALKSGLGADWDILKTPGLKSSASFFAFASAPSGKLFNFADSGENCFLAPPLWYLAAAYAEPELVETQRRFIAAGRKGLHHERFAALIPFSWIPRQTEGARTARTADAAPLFFFRGGGENPVAVRRSGWTSPADRYFAIKAGGAGVNHGHMDGGSFVYESGGVRWAEDLGMQDYESLESKGLDLWNRKQGSDRWKVFRISAESHNVLAIDGAPHRADGLAKFVRADAEAIEIDLTPVFLPGTVGRATRKVEFEGEQIVMVDSITGARPGAVVRWGMSTRASVETAARGARLHSAGQTLDVRFVGNGIAVSIQDISRGSAPYDAPNAGFSRLAAESAADARGNWSMTTRLGTAASD